MQEELHVMWNSPLLCEHTEFEAESLIENADNYRHGTDHLQLGF